MRWASNKRLHLELGFIKAIQSLGEVRISDVIKVLDGAADQIQATGVAVAPTPAPAPASEPAAESVPAPAPEPDPVPAKPEPAPEPAPNAAASASSDPFDKLAAMAETAPESRPDDPPPPPPKEAPAPVEAPPKPDKPDPKAAQEAFYQDPLIQKALEIFEGTIKA